MKKIRHLVMTEIAKTDETSCELAKLAAENDIEIIYVQRGSSWDSGGWHFECLYPGKTTKTDNINDTSMVLRVNVGETAFLMTGDITGDAEETLDEEKIRDIDVLKVAHHGSKYSSSEIFLKKIGAKMAVISCGKDNRYGHPAPETLERLKVQNMKIYTTMDKGAVLMFVVINYSCNSSG